MFRKERLGLSCMLIGCGIGYGFGGPPGLVIGGLIAWFIFKNM